jgi:hypothetical protein
MINKDEDKVRALASSEFSYPVMLSEVRRQPNGVEAPHVCGQRLRRVKAFPPQLTLIDSLMDGHPGMLSRFNSAFNRHGVSFGFAQDRLSTPLGCASLAQDDRLLEE